MRNKIKKRRNHKVIKSSSNVSEAKKEVKAKTSTKRISKPNYYLVTRAIVEDPKKKLRAIKKATIAARYARIRKRRIDEDTKNNEPIKQIFNLKSSRNWNKDEVDNRKMMIIQCFEEIFQSPPENTWSEIGLILKLRKILNIPKGSRQSIVRVLQNYLNQKETTNNIPVEKRGRKKRIAYGSDQDKLILKYASQSHSISNITALSNENLDPNTGGISTRTIGRFINNHPCIDKSIRQTKKSGHWNADTEWSRARLAQCLQYKEQLRLGALPQDSFERINSNIPPMELCAIVWWDEHHQKIVLGSTSKYEIRVAIDDNQQPCPIKNGGKLPPKRPRTSVKHAEEARGIFGVAIKKDENGILTGIRCPPYCYSGRTVVGIKAYELHKTEELRRVLPLKQKWGGPGRGYKEIYGGNWEAELKKNVNKNFCCITELMDHVVSKSKKVYEGTIYENNFLIFHDGLPAWWESEAQEYLHSLGFRDRQLRAYNETNKNTRYQNKVVGNSPELCRGLDSHGFADFKASIRYHTSLNPESFKTGTPAELWSTMIRCWEMEPTSDRIICDISKFPIVLDKIIQQRGSVVPDENFRTGYRVIKNDGVGFVKRSNKRDRIETNNSSRPTYPTSNKKKNH